MKLLVGYLIDGRHSGIDKYLLRVLPYLHQEGVRTDFLTNTIDGELKERLDREGSELFEIPSLKTPLAQYRAIRRILERGNYDGAYFNISEPLNLIGALAAHACGVRVTVHSHNSAPGGSSAVKQLVRRVISCLCRPLLNACTDVRLSCSRTAARWLYGSKAEDATVLYNPVDSDRFAFQPEIRARAREELGLSDELVLGHVGNLIPAKNQSFLLDLTAEMKRAGHRVLLLLVGEGPDEAMLREKARALGLEQEVRFLGVRSDVDRLIQAMDVFVFPSRNEGFPIALLEAQFSGLPCVYSDVIDREAAIAPNAVSLSLKASLSEWEERVADLAKEPRGGAQIPPQQAERFRPSSLANMLQKCLFKKGE